MGPLETGDPREVGKYRLLRRLGAGGMGQVFLGRSRAGRLVAVKLLRSELADDPKFRRRFAREVELARDVGGFYTAQVVDADPDANPPWLVTAYVPGPSLSEAIEQHRYLPERTVRVLGAGLAEGLTAIHKRGIIHRDLKPSNVILTSDGPRVIDFGIARALDATQTTTVMGTPAFMSPEQVEGREIGPASDVFSLGAVLAYAATGVSPFGTGASDAITYRVVHHAPNLTDLPSALAPLVTACLAKDPSQRPSPSAILSQLAVSTGDADGWLPPDLTWLITTQYLPLADLPADPSVPAEPSSGRHKDDRIVVRDRARRVSPPGPAGSPPDLLSARRGSTRPAVIIATVAVAIAVASLSVTAIVLGSASGRERASASSVATTTTTVTAGAPSNQTVIGGEVSCTSGNLVVGVWVEATRGSGFAFIRLNDNLTSSYHYTLPTPETYTLHVGCGGTSKDWAVSVEDSPRVSGARNSFTCNDVPAKPSYGTCTLR